MINTSAGVRNVFSSVHIERGRGFRCAELIHFGLQHFCLLCRGAEPQHTVVRLSLCRGGARRHTVIVLSVCLSLCL